MDPQKAQQTVERFVEFLRHRRERITEEWISAVHRDARLQASERLSLEELKNHMPLLFENLTSILAAPGSHQVQGDAYQSARDHGMHRFGHGYSLAELLREIARIRVILIEHLFEFSAQTPEFAGMVQRVVQQRLHGFLDELACDSAEEFASAERAQLREGVQEARKECVATESRNQELEKVDESRLRLLRTAAHELRNNVHAAHLAVQDLLESDREMSEKERRGQVQALARQITRMESLLSDLLDYSVILSKRKESLHLEQVSVGELCEELAETYGPLADAKGLHLECTHESELGLVKTDRTKLMQIANNLLSNAVKYTGAGRVHLDLRPAHENRWRLSVEDTGPGIAPEEQQRLFTEFHRARKTAHQQGTGLGLSIVKHLTELLGGEIRVESEPGRGSRFDVVLPLSREEPVPHSMSIAES